MIDRIHLLPVVPEAKLHKVGRARRFTNQSDERLPRVQLNRRLHKIRDTL